MTWNSFRSYFCPDLRQLNRCSVVLPRLQQLFTLPHRPRRSEEHLYFTVIIMGGASSTQRSGKATQSQTILQESINANTPKDIAQVIQSRTTPLHTLNLPQAANIAKDNLNSPNLEVLSCLFITTARRHSLVRRVILNRIQRKTT